MAEVYQIKGNIVLYLLTKYCSILTSRFSVICLWLNSCHMGMCWHDCAGIHPDIDVSKNAIYPISRGWMAAGYQMNGNIVFYLLTLYFSNITSRFSAMWVSIKTGRVIYQNENQACSLIAMFPGTPDAQTAAAKSPRGITWKAILFAICWRNIVQFWRAVFRQYVFDSTLVIWGCVGMIAQEYILILMFSRTPYTQSAAAERLRGIRWKTILFSICWRSTFQI